MFFKSPGSPSWSYENSDVIKDDWPEPDYDIEKGIVQTINEILRAYGWKLLDEQPDWGNPDDAQT